MTGEEREFVGDVATYIAEEVKNGVEVFIVLGFKHNTDRDSMQCRSAQVHVHKTLKDERMGDTAYEIVRAFMAAHHGKWGN